MIWLSTKDDTTLLSYKLEDLLEFPQLQDWKILSMTSFKKIWQISSNWAPYTCWGKGRYEQILSMAQFDRFV